MFNISKISNPGNYYFKSATKKSSFVSDASPVNFTANIHSSHTENLKAYHPSFTIIPSSSKTNYRQCKNISQEQQFNTIQANLSNKDSIKKLENLKQKGILYDNHSNDGSTVLENLYKIVNEPRIIGLDKTVILSEVINALDNPYAITQKFGDIPDIAADEIEKETGKKIPESAKNVVSSSCVAASMEFTLANTMPAEFARFAAGLSGKDYSVDKNIKMSDFSDGYADGLSKLKDFNTTHKIGKKWDDVTIKIKPDRNAIVRARIQTSYKDRDERSCIDVLMQSAILNFASQNTYNTITDERMGKHNPNKTGLTEMEKNFAEQVIFEKPKYSVLYQELNENGILQKYKYKPKETKQHILKSLDLGQNVIIGYTHMDANKQVDGGHEITIVGYEQDKNGKGHFICNDTDDDLDEPIKISEEKLIPLIHHAGIVKEVMESEYSFVDSLGEHLAKFKKILSAKKKSYTKSIPQAS